MITLERILSLKYIGVSIGYLVAFILQTPIIFIIGVYSNTWLFTMFTVLGIICIIIGIINWRTIKTWK